MQRLDCSLWVTSITRLWRQRLELIYTARYQICCSVPDLNVRHFYWFSYLQQKRMQLCLQSAPGSPKYASVWRRMGSAHEWLQKMAAMYWSVADLRVDDNWLLNCQFESLSRINSVFTSSIEAWRETKIPGSDKWAISRNSPAREIVQRQASCIVLSPKRSALQPLWICCEHTYWQCSRAKSHQTTTSWDYAVANRYNSAWMGYRRHCATSDQRCRLSHDGRSLRPPAWAGAFVSVE